MESLLHFLSLTGTGALVGFIIGLTGVGGGSLMTPMLISAFGVAPLTAVGTDLAFAASTKTVGVVAHRRSGHIHWPIVMWMMAGSVSACVLALWFMPSGNSHWVKPSIGVALFFTALAVLYREKILAWSKRRANSTEISQDIKIRPALTLLLSAIIGALVAYSSIGAGAIGCTLLAVLYPRLDSRDIAATDIAYAVPLTAIAAIGHGLKGHIDYALWGALLLGSAPAIYLGVKLAKRLHKDLTNGVLATVLMLASAKSFL